MSLEKASLFCISSEELQGIHSEDCHAFMILLLKMDAHLHFIGDEQALLRKINFLVYELQALCEGLEENDKIHVLNSFFFEKNGFHSIFELRPSSKNFSFQKLLNTKSANSLLLIILYQFFANQIDLPIFAINMEPLQILKWHQKEKCSYIDLNRKGKVFDRNEILGILNHNTSNGDCFETLTIKHIFSHFLEKLSQSLQKENLDSQLMTCLDIALDIDENNLKALCQHGLLCYKIGSFQQALKDLKKYFSFTDLYSAPDDLKKIYQQLLLWRKAEEQPFTPSDILH
ncbi:MAG: hypothetical protein H6625_05925 [Bdellovibrionaceae bacterium]|nr:hypothetical protein [Pseudobdellovibrionaceae bacterium]